MMKRLTLLLTFLALAPAAQALKVVVVDPERPEIVLGSGESKGSNIRIDFIKERVSDYNGKVRIIFIQNKDETERNVFAGLQGGYEGLLKNGQLSILPDSADKSSKVAAKSGNTSTTLTKFLQQYKLNVVLQTTGEANPPAGTEPSSLGEGSQKTRGNSANALENAPGQTKKK